jgi:hypothetical protein
VKEREGMEAQQQEDVAHVVLFAFRRWSTGRSFNLNWCSLVYFEVTIPKKDSTFDLLGPLTATSIISNFQ